VTEGRCISVAPKLGHVPGVDGIRGFGVMIVLVGHLLPKGYDSLNAIIDTFFVLSAFLIVSLLMQEHRSQGRIDLRKFFSRRAIRLLPNSYAVMGVWMLIWLLLSQLVIPGIDRSTATPDMLDAKVGRVDPRQRRGRRAVRVPPGGPGRHRRRTPRAVLVALGGGAVLRRRGRGRRVDADHDAPGEVGGRRLRGHLLVASALPRRFRPRPGRITAVDLDGLHAPGSPA
jgi:hypothetical protein